MEQFRRIGEVLGSLKALMVLQDDIQFNRHQCCLLYDMFSLAFDTIAGEIRDNLKLEEKNTKWKALEQPLRELHRVFKEGEIYIKQCIDSKDWWVKLISFHQNKDCIEFHIHNLLSCFPVVIEAIEMAGEISGLDQDDMQKRRLVLLRKYDMEWNDPKLFHWKFGKQYLVPREIRNRMQSVWREDRWLLVEGLKEKISSLGTAGTRSELRLGELLIKKLNNSASDAKLFPSSVLFGIKDYQVRRRLEGGKYKEVQWFGENFGLRQFTAETEQTESEVPTLLSLSHPNILQYLCGFLDEMKKEYFLIMELIPKDLSSYMKDNNGARRRNLFPLHVSVDIMLQIARGMEYLHSQMIYHGDLNPSNVFMKPRNSSEGSYLVKVGGFGLPSIKNPSPRNSPNQIETNPFIWHAPEVMAEQEQQGPGRGTVSSLKKTEKADVYSFGMLCFELLTGKVPFEDGHLQGEKMSRNIRAGERPLFPFPTPKYLVSLTKKCWHSDPSQRLCFSSVCRILRQVKKFLAMNPESNQPELQRPTVDYCEVEAGVARKFSSDGVGDLGSVSQIPFQMFAHRLAEKEKISPSKIKTWDSASDVFSISKYDCASIYRDDIASVLEDPFTIHASDTRSLYSDMRSVYSEAPPKKMPTSKKLQDTKIRKCIGTTPETKPLPTSRLPSRSTTRPRALKTNRDILLPFSSPLSKGRRRPNGHVSDSEIR